MRGVGQNIKNKPRTEPCYKGPTLTYDAFVNVYMSIRMPTEAVLRHQYNRFLEDLTKTKFAEYKKSNYDLLRSIGLLQRVKKLTPRNKKFIGTKVHEW